MDIPANNASFPAQGRGYEALEKVWKAEESMLRSVIFGIVLNPDDADDVLQQTRIDVFRYGHKFAGLAKPSTYLYRAAGRHAHAHLVRNKRLRFISLDWLRGAFGLEIGSEVEDPVEQVLQADLSRRIVEKIRCLEAAEREIVSLRALRGLEFREIADIVDIGTTNAVMRRYRTAISKLKREMRDEL
jgi:RNA polymerase sigma factor (sigma-70 family)